MTLILWCDYMISLEHILSKTTDALLVGAQLYLFPFKSCNSNHQSFNRRIVSSLRPPNRRPCATASSLRSHFGGVGKALAARGRYKLKLILGGIFGRVGEGKTKCCPWPLPPIRGQLWHSHKLFRIEYILLATTISLL